MTCLTAPAMHCRKLAVGCRVACPSAGTLLVLVFLLALSCGRSLGATYIWDANNKGAEGSWSDASHWSVPNSYPHLADDVATITGQSQFPAAPAKVDLDLPVSLNTLYIAPPITDEPNKLSIAAFNGGLQLMRNSSNALPLVDNEGLIEVLRSLTSTDEATLEGSGKIVLYDTDLGAAVLSGIFRNQSTIEGGGLVTGTLYNKGTVRATGGQKMTLYATTDNNGGLLTTDGSGSMGASGLDISAKVQGGTIDHNGGVIRFVSTQLTDVYVSGPLVDFDGASGHLMVDWPGITFSGHCVITPTAVLSTKADGGGQPGTQNTWLRLTNGATLENRGIIRLESAGPQVEFCVQDVGPGVGATATLDGFGTLVLSGSSNWITTGASSNLEHGPDHTIEGFGHIAGNVSNKGLIMAKGGELSIAGTMTNLGNLAASPGGRLAFRSAVIAGNNALDGKISPNGGLVVVSDSTVSYAEWRPGNVQFQSGKLMGNSHFLVGAVVDVPLHSSITIPGNHMLTNDGEIHLNGDATLDTGVQGSALGTVAILTGGGRLYMLGAQTGAYMSYPSLRSMSAGAHPSMFFNDTNHTIQGAGSFYALVLNAGSIIVENGWLSVYQALTGDGAVSVTDTGTLSLQTNIETGSLMMTTGAVLKGNGYTIKLTRGGFQFLEQTETCWSGTAPRLRFSAGSGPQPLEVGGEDFGALWKGFDYNFHLKSLIVDGNQTWVDLVDQVDNGNRHSPEAIYVESLQVLDGAALNLNGLNLYTFNNGNPYLVQVGDGALFGGGAIVNVPEPGTLLLVVAAGLGGLAFRKNGRPSSRP